MRSFLILMAVAVLASSCGEKDAKTEVDAAKLAVIDSLEAILFRADGSLNDRGAAMALVKAYATYYQAHPQDTAAINMLFKAGEVSMGLSDGQLAVKYFTTVAEQHTTFAKAPEALFLAAFCEETLNGDAQQAKFFYEEFLKKYPAHGLAKDAQFSIQNLGKTDEELIKMFEQNLKEG
jgi:hypothetical protein